MPSEADHIVLANENQSAMEDLLGEGARFNGWIATIAFYKALHVVEAVFANQPLDRERHSANHATREAKIKRQFPGMWKPYFRLLSASKVARYMEGNHVSFERYMTRSHLLTSHLAGSLADLESRCAILLGDAARDAFIPYRGSVGDIPAS
jgi:hypothetical protein